MKITIQSILILSIFASLTEARVLTGSKIISNKQKSNVSDKKIVEIPLETEIRNKLNQEIKKNMLKDNESNSSENESKSKKSIVPVENKSNDFKIVDLTDNKKIEFKTLSNFSSSLKNDSSIKDNQVNKLDNKSKKSVDSEKEMKKEILIDQKSEKNSEETSFKTDPSMKDYKLNESEKQSENIMNEGFIDMRDIKSEKNSEETSFKTNPSMKDYDYDQADKKSEKSVISETVIQQKSQVLDEKSSEIEKEETENQTKSESLKITSAFISVMTLITLL